MFGSPIIIGGSSRSGKTWLANYLDVEAVGGYNIEFELLFNIYSFYYWPANNQKRKTILLEYMNRPRAISPDKTKSVVPSQYISKDKIANFIDNAAQMPSVLQAIHCLLNGICSAHGKSFWVGGDYHAEHLYKKYVADISNLKLITTVRNPREVVCASLYWRTYPQKIDAPDKEIDKRLNLWKTSFLLSQKQHGNVMLLNMNKIWATEEHELFRLKTFISNDNIAIDIKDAGRYRHWFCCKEDLFLTPNNTYEALLTMADIASIDKKTRAIWVKFSNEEAYQFKILDKLICFKILCSYLWRHLKIKWSNLEIIFHLKQYIKRI